MFRPELGKKLSDGSSLPVTRLFQSLADALVHIGIGGDVEQTLVGLRILNYCGGFAFNREDDGALALFELFHEVAGAAPKGRERLNVLGNVENTMVSLLFKHPSKCYRKAMLV